MSDRVSLTVIFTRQDPDQSVPLYAATPNCLLSNFRPVVITEYGTNTWPKFGATPEDLKNLAQVHSYQLRIFNLKSKNLIPITESTWLSGYANIILVPEERIGEFQ